MPLGRRAPTNLENRHGAEKPRAIPSPCSDWLGEDKGQEGFWPSRVASWPTRKCDRNVVPCPFLCPNYSHVPGAASDRWFRGEWKMDSREFGPQRDFMASGGRVGERPGLETLSRPLQRDFELLVPRLCSVDFYNSQPTRNRERTQVTLGGLGPPARRQETGCRGRAWRGAHFTERGHFELVCTHARFSLFYFFGMGRLFIVGRVMSGCISFVFITF